jgi:ABC-2 type transport system permease protein
MTTITRPPAYQAAQRVTPVRVLRAEWTKLRSLPSTAWTLLIGIGLTVGLSAGYSMLRVARPPRHTAELAGFDPTAVSLAGVQLAQLAIGVLGVLLITGEFATGTIRTSYAAVPTRLPMLWGKTAALALTTLALCLPATVAAFLLGQSILSAQHLDTTFGRPGVARAVLGSALYLAAVGLLGLGLGALIRHTAGAVAAVLGALFAPQLLVGFLPDTWQDSIYKYLPPPAGSAITTVRPDPTSSLHPWTGYGLFCLYTAVVLGLAAWQLRRRDA